MTAARTSTIFNLRPGEGRSNGSSLAEQNSEEAVNPQRRLVQKPGSNGASAEGRQDESVCRDTVQCGAVQFGWKICDGSPLCPEVLKGIRKVDRISCPCSHHPPSISYYEVFLLVFFCHPTLLPLLLLLLLRCIREECKICLPPPLQLAHLKSWFTIFLS